jgi:hypothetical protein
MDRAAVMGHENTQFYVEHVLCFVCTVPFISIRAYFIQGIQCFY